MTPQDILQMIDEMRSMDLSEKIIDIFVKEAIGND